MRLSRHLMCRLQHSQERVRASESPFLRRRAARDDRQAFRRLICTCATGSRSEESREKEGWGEGEGEREREGVVVPVRRASRLTGSQLANALGWWKGGREQVWEEKLGLREPFRGNDATRWGSKHEPVARDHFEHLTGLKVLDVAAACQLYTSEAQRHGAPLPPRAFYWV